MMNKPAALTAALWVSFALTAAAQSTQPTASGSNTGSLQAGNTKPVAAANGTLDAATKKPARGRHPNTRTTNATGSTQPGTHNGVRNPGSSARLHVHAANAQKTDKPASSGQAGQGTPGVHSKRKTEAQKYSGINGASGGRGPKQ